MRQVGRGTTSGVGVLTCVAPHTPVSAAFPLCSVLQKSYRATCSVLGMPRGFPEFNCNLRWLKKVKAWVSAASRLASMKNKRDARSSESDWFRKNAAEADVMLDEVGYNVVYLWSHHSLPLADHSLWPMCHGDNARRFLCCMAGSWSHSPCLHTPLARLGFHVVGLTRTIYRHKWTHRESGRRNTTSAEPKVNCSSSWNSYSSDSVRA